jgi:hypothetical protein
MTVKRFHGSKEPRGLSNQPHSPSFEGRFGRMFRTLVPAKFTDDALRKLSLEMVAPLDDPATPETDVDDEENQGIDAGYTYLGQFIDHDLTFDPASSLQKENDPQGLVNFRTPRFDLDSLYGRGPDDQPYLYEDDGIRMLLGRPLNFSQVENTSRDLPRNERKRALIGDPRNDENVIVSQLQASMLRFHNRVADLMHDQGKNPSFEDVQRAVRWHYQWVVLHDFLPTMVGADPVQSPIQRILPRLLTEKAVEEAPAPVDPYGAGTTPAEPAPENPKLPFFKWKENAYIPVEFTVAAYRYGHSMVRPIYRLNTWLADRQTIFGPDPANTLEGFREFPDTWAINWHLFFGAGGEPTSGPSRVQKSYKIDTSLVNPLGHLPQSTVKSMPSLAERNLIRGSMMGLPSGQSVAKHMGFKPISDDKLKIGKATAAASGTNKTLVEIDHSFKHKAPLWYYILSEAQSAFTGDDSQPIHLGPVGGTIVAEVIIGLMVGDQHSYLSQDPDWKPFPEFCRNDEFKMIDLLTQASLVRL